MSTNSTPKISLSQGNTALAQQSFFSIKLLKKELVAQDVWALTFERPNVFDFLAGQFVQFRVPDGDKSVLRSYSISSPPQADYMEFLVKFLPNGKASMFFNSLEIGDSAEISSAKGRFIVNDSTADKIFIATGTGLAPVMSMVESELAFHNRLLRKGEGEGERSRSSTELIFGVRSEADLFWSERLNNFSVQSNSIIKITLSQPSIEWQGLRGRVTEHLTLDKNAEYYLCGSVEMATDVRKMLIDNQISKTQIHFEIF